MLTQIVRGLWFLACFALLILFLAKGNEQGADIVFGYGMMALTFPIGVAIFLGWGTLALASSKLGFAVGSSSTVGTIVVWCTMVAGGYWQWRRIRRSW